MVLFLVDNFSFFFDELWTWPTLGCSRSGRRMIIEGIIPNSYLPFQTWILNFIFLNFFGGVGLSLRLKMYVVLEPGERFTG